MALRGGASKSVKHGRTPSADWTEVADTPYLGPSPDLPRLSNRRKWTDIVVEWWETTRSMPHCVLWTPSDWQFAVETALMKDLFWRNYSDGDMKGTMATEIRRRESQLGTTAEALRQLRIRYVKSGAVDEPAPHRDPVVVEQTGQPDGIATVTPLDERRARLTRSQAV